MMHRDVRRVKKQLCSGTELAPPAVTISARQRQRPAKLRALLMQRNLRDTKTAAVRLDRFAMSAFPPTADVLLHCDDGSKRATTRQT